MSKIITLDCGHDNFVPDNFENKLFYIKVCEKCQTGYAFILGR